MKKLLRNLLTGCLLVMLTLVLVPSAKADAAVKQTGITANAVTVKWDAERNATRYVVYVGSSSSKCSQYAVLSPTQTSITISGLPAGCERYVKVTYDWKSSSSTGKIYTDSFAGSVYAVTLPGKVTNLKQEKWWYLAKSFDAVWDEQEGVTGYEYVVKTNKGKVKAQGKKTYSGGNYLSVDKISNSVVYTGQVRAYTVINGQTYYGPWSDVAYFFTQPQLSKAKVSRNKLTVKWKKVAGASGYDVYVSTKATSGYKKVKSVSSKKSSVTLTKFNKKKFSSKKKYYVYVAAKKKTKSGTYTSGKLYYWCTKNFRANSRGYF